MEKDEDTFEYWVSEASKGRNIAECWQNCYRIREQALKEYKKSHKIFNDK